jgi:hypothetical protein
MCIYVMDSCLSTSHPLCPTVYFCIIHCRSFCVMHGHSVSGDFW